MQRDISVIVPVYNSEKWIPRCIESISSQSFPFLEIICVNDCSTDDSLALLNAYAQEDSRIVIVNLPENKGQAVARDAGMEIAKGKYMGFVDSDDTIDTGFFEALHAEAEKYCADMVCAPIRIVDSRNIKREVPHWTWFCSSLFRTDFLRKNAITFPAEFSTGPDMVFMVRVLMSSPVRRQIDSVYYNYYQVSTSASHNRTDKKCLSCLMAFSQVFSEIEQKVQSGTLSPTSAQMLVRDIFQLLLNEVEHRFTDNLKIQASAYLLKLYYEYPYLEETKLLLQNSSPELAEILINRNEDELKKYFLRGKNRLAATLRERLKKQA